MASAEQLVLAALAITTINDICEVLLSNADQG